MVAVNSGIIMVHFTEITVQQLSILMVTDPGIRITNATEITVRQLNMLMVEKPGIRMVNISGNFSGASIKVLSQE